MKWGSKYDYQYVNRLNKSIKKHTKRATQLYCFTEDSIDIDKDIHQTNDDLELIVDRFDFVISSNTTSAIIEALSCGKTTFLFKDKNNFDLSPLKNTILEEKINFFYTDKDLLNKIDNNNDKIKPIKYYYLNKDLNRWKKILEIKN